jgi:hypothetical protein
LRRQRDTIHTFCRRYQTPCTQETTCGVNETPHKALYIQKRIHTRHDHTRHKCLPSVNMRGMSGEEHSGVGGEEHSGVGGEEQTEYGWRGLTQSAWPGDRRHCPLHRDAESDCDGWAKTVRDGSDAPTRMGSDARAKTCVSAGRSRSPAVAYKRTL